MSWQTILAGLSLIREILKYFRERQGCNCKKKQAEMLVSMKNQVTECLETDTNLNITA